MKKPILKKSALAVMLLAIMSCGKDDEPTVAPNTAPVMTAQSFMVSEAATGTDVLGTVVATDLENDALSFSIKTNSNNLFEITTAGEISLASGQALDFETATSHTLSIDAVSYTHLTLPTIYSV